MALIITSNAAVPFAFILLVICANRASSFVQPARPVPYRSHTVRLNMINLSMATTDGDIVANTSIRTATSTRTKDMSPSAVKARKLYSWSEARRKARTYGFTSQQEFVEYECAGSYQLPKNSDEVWADEWTSWEDFLGVPLKFEEAKAVARALARDKGVNSEEAYLELKKRANGISDDDMASRLPLKPDLYYRADWTSWDDFLGL